MDNKPNIQFAPKTHPLLAILPPHLKNPANYQAIQKEIIKSFRSTCDHSEMEEWATCKKCTQKMLDRRILLRELGFKNPAQYMLWQKTHEEIIKRFPLVDWKTGKALA